jgi:hypothetical protein
MDAPRRTDDPSPRTAQSTRDSLRAQNLRTVAALAALFLVPLAVSFWLYYAGWSPAKHVNHGELLQPPRPLPVVSLPAAGGGGPVANVFAKRWALVYLGDGRCDSACRRALYVMRQARVALNEDMPRLERVFLATANCCDEAFLTTAYPGLIVLDASGSSASRLLGSFPADRGDSVFIVDPLGNLMMRYDARHDPRGLLQDLQLLLRLSHIG